MLEHRNIRGTVVLVDDDPEMRAMLSDHLKEDNYRVKAFESGMTALQFLSSSHIEAQSVDLVLTDLRMPEIDGLTVLRQCKMAHPFVPVILITAHASVDSAVEGLRRGAFDYLTKPFKLSEISIAIERAISFGRMQRQNQVLSSEIKKSWGSGDIVGKSPAMKNIIDLIDRVASASSNILITGESGTGKEVVARSIHERSGKTKAPFVAINVTAIPDSLLESELFGHVKGSFTGAHQDKKGLFEEANDGTLFLDEIGDMDLSLQSKLLRVLQERTIKPVGSNTQKPVNVRVIAATHKDLKKAILNGSFREDLYYRLCVIPLVIPPLRHRTEDIPLLAQHFLHKYSHLNGSKVLGFSQSALQKLMAMPWHGNVRELQNMIERVVVLTSHPMIQPEDIPSGEDQEVENFFGQTSQEFPTLEQMEKRYIHLVLDKTGGKKEKAAQILGINRRTLYRKEREYGFVAEDAELEATED